MGHFDVANGSMTIALNTNQPNNRMYGVFNTSIIPPPGGKVGFDSLRYGLSDRRKLPGADHEEELTNGPVIGPEGHEGVQLLQMGVDAGAFAKAPWNIAPKTPMTDQDAIDVQFLAYKDPEVGETSLWHVVDMAIAGAVMDHPEWAVPVATPTELGGHGSQTGTTPTTTPLSASVVPLIPVSAPTPTPAPDLSSTILAQLGTLLSMYGTLRADVAAIKSGSAGVPTSAPAPVAPSAPLPSAPLLDPSALAGILSKAQIGLSKLTASGIGTSGGGPWAIKLRELCLAIVSAEKE